MGETVTALRDMAKVFFVGTGAQYPATRSGSVTPRPRYVPPPNVFDRQDVAVRTELQGRAPKLKIVALAAIRTGSPAIRHPDE
jgi:hypothetical protein